MELLDDLKVIAFDCFGTGLDASPLSREKIEDYNEVKKQLICQPYSFPQVWYQLRRRPTKHSSLFSKDSSRTEKKS